MFLDSLSEEHIEVFQGRSWEFSDPALLFGDVMIEIRKAQTGDAAGILEMYEAIIDDTEGKAATPRWEKGVYPNLRYIEQAIANGELIVALDGGKPVGGVIRNHEAAAGYERVKWGVEASRSEVYVIHTLGVSPDFQHKGVASKLAEAVEEDAREHGVKAIRLDVIDGNYPSVMLFEKLGYENLGRHILDYPSQHNVGFTLMELVLN